jgi:hypothetical protein
VTFLDNLPCRILIVIPIQQDLKSLNPDHEKFQDSGFSGIQHNLFVALKNTRDIEYFGHQSGYIPFLVIFVPHYLIIFVTGKSQRQVMSTMQCYYATYRAGSAVGKRIYTCTKRHLTAVWFVVIN